MTLFPSASLKININRGSVHSSSSVEICYRYTVGSFILDCTIHCNSETTPTSNETHY